MTKKDIDNIISIICPNDEDFEKSIISPAYLKKELEALALEQHPCEDAIRRKDVLDLCDSTDPEYKVVHFKEDVECLPSANPQPKTGRWIYSDECHEHGRCSECGYGIVDLVNGGPHNFCRRCGAKMIESEDN